MSDLERYPTNNLRAYTTCARGITAFSVVHFLMGFILFLSINSFHANAQEQWEKEGEGEIKDVEIEIIKDRQITLPRANRNFEKVPSRPFELIQPAITYEFKNFQIGRASCRERV